MTTFVVLTVVEVVALIAGLAFYLAWVGTLLNRIAGNLEACSEIVKTIADHARRSYPGSSTSTGRVEWWPARCRCCTDSRSRLSLVPSRSPLRRRRTARW